LKVATEKSEEVCKGTGLKQGRVINITETYDVRKCLTSFMGFEDGDEEASKVIQGMNH
jgi:hypothetical protein